jgi:hypothetical protein
MNSPEAIASASQRGLAIAAIDDLLWTTPHNRALAWHANERIRSFTGDVIVDCLTFTWVEHENQDVEFALTANAILNICRQRTTRYLFGKEMQSRSKYQIIADNTDLAFRRFPEDTPEDQAPAWGHERWDFDTRKPNVLIFYGRQRRYDHYEEHGGPNDPIIRDGRHGSPKRFDKEFSNILALVNEAKAHLLYS